MNRLMAAMRAGFHAALEEYRVNRVARRAVPVSDRVPRVWR